MKLYELSNDFAELFDNFDTISAMTFSKNEMGEFVDDDDNPVPDPEVFKAAMLEAWFDTLEGIEDEFERKAENIGAYIKQLEAEQDALSAEKKRLEARISAKKNQSERLCTYLLAQMRKINLKKIDMPKAKITASDGRESVCISDETALIRWAEENCTGILNPQPPKIVKKEISALIKGGTEIPYTSLIRKPYITVK